MPCATQNCHAVLTDLSSAVQDEEGKTSGKRQAEGTPAASSEHGGPPVKKAKAEMSGSDAAAPATLIAVPEAPAINAKPAVQQTAPGAAPLL